MGILDHLLGGLPPVLVYLVVGGLVAAESAVVAGLVLPAATALIAIGLLANAGTVRVVPAAVTGVVAAWAGGSLAYRSGRRHGPRLRTTRLGRWIGDKRWERAERLFTRFGGRAIFMAQWIVGARTLVPRLAGMNGVSYRRFIVWQMPSAVLWSGWMVGASYAAGASYDLLAARAGRAGGALAVLVVLIVALVLAGRWLGRHPTVVHRSNGRAFISFGRLKFPRTAAAPLVDLVLSVTALCVLATVLVLVIPLIMRFSGLSAVDSATGDWARGQWTSDGYRFALETATFADPGVLFAVAVVVSAVRGWRRRRSGAGVLSAVGPVLPVVVLAAALAWATPSAGQIWEAPSAVVFPSATEFDGHIPFDAAGPMASLAAGHTAQLVGAVGLLAWMLAGRLPWKWRVAVWTVAAVYVVVCAGSWVYLGWSRTSETVAAVLTGVAWAVLNAAIWSAPRRDPAVAEGGTGLDAEKAGEPVTISAGP
ncbi:DedA family protein [Actinoplanes sp. NPDC051411]|uniref:DedA family protein n=1 Tax=Actinoplanes sp. NPDC051411 TaxID=3155522 RepID=UPI003449B325